jgi:hypothetical protein
MATQDALRAARASGRPDGVTRPGCRLGSWSRLAVPRWTTLAGRPVTLATAQ